MMMMMLLLPLPIPLDVSQARTRGGAYVGSANCRVSEVHVPARRTQLYSSFTLLCTKHTGRVSRVLTCHASVT